MADALAIAISEAEKKMGETRNNHHYAIEAYRETARRGISFFKREAILEAAARKAEGRAAIVLWDATAIAFIRKFVFYFGSAGLIGLVLLIGLLT